MSQQIDWAKIMMQAADAAANRRHELDRAVGLVEHTLRCAITSSTINPPSPQPFSWRFVRARFYPHLSAKAWGMARRHISRKLRRGETFKILIRDEKRGRNR